MSEFEAILLIAIIAFLGGYAYRLIRAWARRLAKRRREAALDIKVKRSIWKRWA